MHVQTVQWFIKILNGISEQNIYEPTIQIDKKGYDTIADITYGGQIQTNEQG